MVAERTEKFRTGTHLDALVLAERDGRIQTSYRIADGDRIVQRPERIHHDVEPHVLHNGADVVRETASHQKNPVAETYLETVFRNLHRSL